MPSAASNTVYGIISDAMHDAGYLQEGDLPNSEQLASNQRRLADIINFWQIEGLKLFLLEDLALTLVAGQNLYTLQPTLGSINMTKPLRVLQAYVLVTVGNTKRPLNVLSWNEWMDLSQSTGNTGTVNSYFVDKRATSLHIYFWQTPDASEATNAAHLLIQVQAPNPANLEENVSFPQEWRMALRWALADDICTGQPQAIMDRCASRSRYYKEVLEGWDVEDAPTRFTPDQRSMIGGGDFQ